MSLSRGNGTSPVSVWKIRQRERVDVGAPVDLLLPLDLLGGEVVRRADHLADPGQAVAGARAAVLGEPEVGQVGVAAVDEDVGGLDVAVDQTGDVGGVQRGGDLAADVQHPVGAEPALLAQDRGQVRAGDVLHRDVEQAVDLAGVVDRDDVRMRERRGDPGLAQEALAEVGVVGQITAR